MIYLVQCLKSVSIKTLRLELSKGQTFDCRKDRYDTNPELQRLVREGVLSLRVKGNAPARLGVHSNNRFQVVRESKVVKEVVEKPVVVEKPIIVEKVVEKIIERPSEQPQVDMNALANVLLQQLGTMISPEAIAEAVAKQMPTQQVVVNNNAQTNQSAGNMNTTSDEALTFIPSNIISSKAKASSESLANETKSEGSEELSDALSALKALRKANKQ
tara:strand:- start:49 stop:696 length:648 start_codon:yes stop_codon:yes gene_type:complete